MLWQMVLIGQKDLATIQYQIRGGREGGREGGRQSVHNNVMQLGISQWRSQGMAECGSRYTNLHKILLDNFILKLCK